MHSRRVAGLASRQHGVVSRSQLLAAGMSAREIVVWQRHRRLHPLHRGVYAVGHRALTRRARWMAAVLAAGPGAVLSHRSAAALWGVRDGHAIEVTAPRQCRRPGITAHRAALRPDETTTHDGNPVTSAARTLFDLAAVVSRHQLERAIAQAEFLRLTGPLSLDALLTRYPGARGAAPLAAVTTAQQPLDLTRSELESRFVAFLDAHGVARPRTNVNVEGAERDCVWPRARLVVELDGRAAHATPAAFERDRARDRALTRAGWRVVRITWRQLHDDPERLAQDLLVLTRG
jgi:very-short-patch-repair endonuclease